MNLGAQLRELFDGLGELLVEHLRLAKLELKDDARYLGVRLGVIALLAPLVLVGYGFLCVAGALALTPRLGAPLAFCLVGAVNLLGGGLGVAAAARQLGHRRVLGATASELSATRSELLARGEGQEAGP